MTILGAICGLGTVVTATAMATTLPAHAQDDVAAFYKGKTIQLRVGSAAGGGYDTIARAIARHMGRHIPGYPTIAVQNVPAAAVSSFSTTSTPWRQKTGP